MSLEPSEHETPLDLVTLPVTAHERGPTEREPNARAKKTNAVYDR